MITDSSSNNDPSTNAPCSTNINNATSVDTPTTPPDMLLKKYVNSDPSIDNQEKKIFLNRYLLQYLSDSGYIESLVQQLNTAVKSNENYKKVENNLKSMKENSTVLSTTNPAYFKSECAVENCKQNFYRNLKKIIDECVDPIKENINTMTKNITPLLRELIPNGSIPKVPNKKSDRIRNKYQIDYAPYLRKVLAFGTNSTSQPDEPPSCSLETISTRSNYMISSGKFNFPHSSLVVESQENCEISHDKLSFPDSPPTAQAQENHKNTGKMVSISSSSNGSQMNALSVVESINNVQKSDNYGESPLPPPDGNNKKESGDSL